MEIGIDDNERKTRYVVIYTSCFPSVSGCFSAIFTTRHRLRHTNSLYSRIRVTLFALLSKIADLILVSFFVKGQT